MDQFAGWLRRPVQPGRLRSADTDSGPALEASTVSRALNSVYMFYEFLARRGVGMGAQLIHRRATSFGDHGGFLAGIAERQVTVRPTRLKQTKCRPPTPRSSGSWMCWGSRGVFDLCQADGRWLLGVGRG
ncbi:hypothetical protein [Streptomyces sp. NPDC006510]|uniref:hypothetical protein n=1 Tax=Streptomyces sp. NPDC006510 TaxID=3155600 RepID=UPI0033A85990